MKENETIEKKEYMAKIMSILAIIISIFNTVWGINYTREQDEKKNKIELIRTMDKQFNYIEEKKLEIQKAKASIKITKKLIKELEKEALDLQYSSNPNKDRLLELQLELSEEVNRNKSNKEKIYINVRFIMSMAEVMAYSINNDLYDKKFFTGIFGGYFKSLKKEYKTVLAELKKKGEKFSEFEKLVKSLN